MKTQLPKTSKGFTLVELMVVIVILAILAVVGITVFSNTQGSARDARRKADIQAISNALESNYSTNGSYQGVTTSMFANGIIPTDPQTNNTYATIGNYPTSGTTNTTYNVCASLENPTGGSFCLKNQR